MDFKKLIWTRKYKAGYELRRGVVDNSDLGSPDFEMTYAFNPNGDSIGRPKTAHFLCSKLGIAPVKAKESHCVCSIGYSKKSRKWYGWSHRAIFGFKPGSKTKLGSCGFNPKNKTEFLASLKSWYKDDMYRDVKFKKRANGVKVSYHIKQKGTGRVYPNNHLEEYPKVWGKGAWTAKNNDDAKRMAIDFADGVS